MPSANKITTFQKSKMADGRDLENSIKFLDLKNPKWQNNGSIISSANTK